MDEYGLIYLLVGAVLIIGIGLGMWRLRVTRGPIEDPHSGLTEIEEAERKLHP
jgi:hypothetical protein